MVMQPVRIPPKLRQGDRIRFVSPASAVDENEVLKRASALEALGFRVDFGVHAFDRHGWLAGSDEARLDDLNMAYRDPEIRAVFATRGGKGSYRIADRLDFESIGRDPKPLVGFSDITALHLALINACHIMGIHGAVFPDQTGGIDLENCSELARMLCETGVLTIHPRPGEPTSQLTTSGRARGPLIGGNLDLVATSAGWALPNLDRAILLLEAVDCYPGQVDRALTMLRKAGHLTGVAGLAIGQFIMTEPKRGDVVLEVMRDHFQWLGVPVLGGLPVGHGIRPVSLPIGTMADLDADAGVLRVEH